MSSLIILLDLYQKQEEMKRNPEVADMVGTVLTNASLQATFTNTDSH